MKLTCTCNSNQNSEAGRTLAVCRSASIISCMTIIHFMQTEMFVSGNNSASCIPPNILWTGISTCMACNRGSLASSYFPCSFFLV